MTFSRKRAAGLWIFDTEVTPAEFEAFDEDLSNAVDGGAGGTVTPTSPIVVASGSAAGLQVQNTGFGYPDDVYGFYQQSLLNPTPILGDGSAPSPRFLDSTGASPSAPTGGCYSHTDRVWLAVGGNLGCWISYDDGHSFEDFHGAMATGGVMQDVAMRGNNSSAVAVNGGLYNQNYYRSQVVGGGSWSAFTPPGFSGAGDGLNCVRFEPVADRYIIAGAIGSTSPYVGTSDNNVGSAWTNRSAALPGTLPSAGLRRLAVGLSMTLSTYVVCATSNSAHTKIIRSTDAGVTWSDSTTTLTSDQYDICFFWDQFLWVAVGRTTGKIYTSPDGDAWTLKTTLSSVDLSGTNGQAIAGYGRFLVIAGKDSNSAPVMAFSWNYGVTWQLFRSVRGAGFASVNCLIPDDGDACLLGIGGYTGMRFRRIYPQ